MRAELMGAPGAGKGTQAKKLAHKFRVPHVSTGEILRESIAAETEVGKEAAKILQRGELVPDSLAIRIVSERLSRGDCEAGYLLDGYPRTMTQLEALDRFLVSRGWNRSAVLSLEVPDEEIVKRIAGRGQCRQCGPVKTDDSDGKIRCPGCGEEVVQRDDDKEAVLRNRLAVYRRETAPLLSVYRARKLLLEIDGLGDEAEVHRRICSALDGVAA